MNVSNPGEHSKGGSNDDTPTEVTWANRLLQRAPPTARGHIVAAIGEFAGTLLFLVGI